MDVKEAAKQVIDNLPGEPTMEDIIHALYIKAKCERGDQEIEDGKGIPQEEVREHLKKWLK